MRLEYQILMRRRDRPGPGRSPLAAAPGPRHRPAGALAGGAVAPRAAGRHALPACWPRLPRTRWSARRPGGRFAWPPLGASLAADVVSIVRDLHHHCRAGPGPAQHGRVSSLGGRRPGRGPAARGRDRRPRHRAARRGGRRPGGRGKRGREHRGRRDGPALFSPRWPGPVGAMVYRAVNTLDSMFGHQDDRYRAVRLGGGADRRPGQLPAGAAHGPAGVPGGRCCCGCGRGRACATSCCRDGRNHASPNSGLAEAAMAGALGVQLGGVTYYDGEPLEKPTIGDAFVPLVAPPHPAGQRPDVRDQRAVSRGVPCCCGRGRSIFGTPGGPPDEPETAHPDLHRRRQGQDHGRPGHGLPRQRSRPPHLRHPVHQERRARWAKLPPRRPRPTSRSITTGLGIPSRRPTIRGSPSIGRRRRRVCARRPK